MDNRKLGQLIVSTIAIVWIFCISFIISMKVAENSKEKATTTFPITQQQQHTTAPGKPASTTNPVTTMPRQDGIGNHVSMQVSVGDPEWLIAEQEASKKAEEEASKKAEQEALKNTTKPSTTKPKSNVPEGKNEIITAYINGVNQLKKEQNFSLNKEDKLNITIDEITGGSVVKGLAENMISNGQTPPESFSFVGGVDANTGSTPTQVIAPINVNASVNPDAVTSAVAAPTSDGGYTLKLTFIDETQTYTTPAPNLSTMVEVIDINELLVNGITIKDVSFLYSGTYIEATFNKAGKITSMKHYLCVSECVGNGSLAMIPVSVVIHGDFTSIYNISY